MLIRYRNNGVEKHVQNDVGRGFIDAGLADDITPAAPKLPPAATWEVRLGEREGFPPYLHVRCSTCGNSQTGEGPTVHKTAKFLHCHIAESCPPEIGKQYEKARDKYKRGADVPEGLGVSATQREIENKRLERLAAGRR
jgi:hypothetical protein